MSFTPTNLAPGCVGLTAWGYWTYRIVRAVSAAGGIGTYWAERGLFGKIAFVIWALIAVQVVLIVVFIIGMLLFMGVKACIKTTAGAIRSARDRRS